MSGPCDPDFAAIAAKLSPDLQCGTAPAVASARSPFDLVNGTLPVVEALMIGLAVAGLVHAVLWWRRHRDPTNLLLWWATVAYVLLLEPPLYFPEQFGLQDQVGLIFVHNLFSLNFLYDRLPLYILALYPGLTYLAYVIVQRAGILRRRGAWAGAAAVAVVFHALYEIFDHIGPQLRWWGWNPDAPTNEPWLASVPLSSAVMFAGASPFGIALLARWLLADRAAKGPLPWWSATWRVVAVGALTPLAMIAFSIPFSVFPESQQALREGVLWAELAVLAVVAFVAYLRTVRERTPSDDAAAGGFLRSYAFAAGVLYLLVFAALWAVALPDLLDASNGLTPEGTPTGNLLYVIVCAVVGVAAVAVIAPRRSRAAGLGEPAPGAVPAGRT